MSALADVWSLIWPVLSPNYFCLFIGWDGCLLGQGKKSRLLNQTEMRSGSWLLCSEVLSGWERSHNLNRPGASRCIDHFAYQTLRGNLRIYPSGWRLLYHEDADAPPHCCCSDAPLPAPPATVVTSGVLPSPHALNSIPPTALTFPAAPVPPLTSCVALPLAKRLQKNGRRTGRGQWLGREGRRAGRCFPQRPWATASFWMPKLIVLFLCLGVLTSSQLLLNGSFFRGLLFP